MNRARNSGFTLLELMATVLIISILSAMAMMQYKQYVVRAHRKEAMAALQGLAQSIERQYAQNNTYMGLAAGGADTGAPGFFATQSPVDGGAATYDLSITVATQNTYSVEAVPIAGTTQDGDGNLQLLSTGERDWDSNHDGAYGTGENTWKDH